MLIREIAILLSSSGVGVFNETTPGGTIYLGFMPSTPDQVIAIFPTQGASPDFKLPYDKPAFQVRVRGNKDIRTAESVASLVFNELHGLHHITLPGGTWLLKCISLQSGPASIGVDGNGRHEFVINFQTEIRNPTKNREE